MKSLLRYPGGKTFAKDIIIPYFENEKEIFSSFFGGGSIELELASKGKRVYGCDVFNQLVNFWNFVITAPEMMYENVKQEWEFFHNDEISIEEKREHYYELKEFASDELQNGTLFQAVDFFIVNRISFSGLTLLGGFSNLSIKMEFGKGILERLRNFKAENLSVELLDFKEAFKKYDKIAAYIDPPYLLKSGWLYGKDGSIHKNFDHQGLKNILVNRDKWVLSYNNCDEVKDLYKDFKMIEPTWRYSMTKEKKSKELLIFSNDIKV